MSGYTVRQAADLLGRSDRLVRKMITDGRLTVTSRNPIVLEAEGVHRQRNQRKAAPAKVTAEPLNSDQIRDLVRVIIAETLPLMLETRDNVEKRLAAELAATTQQLEQVREELEKERSKQIKLPRIGWPFIR